MRADEPVALDDFIHGAGDGDDEGLVVFSWDWLVEAVAYRVDELEIFLQWQRAVSECVEAGGRVGSVYLLCIWT